MKYSKHVQALLVVLLFSHCTKEIPFPDVKDNPLMVINSLFYPGQDLEVHISRTCHIQHTECSNTFIDNAEVLLLDKAGSILTTLEHQASGIYRTADFKVNHNTEYQIEVNSNSQDLSGVTSKGSTPKEVKSTLLGVEEVKIDGNVMWGFDIEIEDDPTEENYYLIEGSFELSVGEHNDGVEEINGYIEPHFMHRTDDPNAENKIIGAGVFDIVTPPLRYVFLPDRNFNGEKYQIRVGVNDRYLYWDGNQKVIANLAVKSVSKEMYEYIKSLTKHSLLSGNPFSEPQLVFTNIENGLGIFAGYSQELFTLELPDSKYNRPLDVMVENDGCTGPCIVKFSTDGGPNLPYFWDFGDGQTSTEANPEHSYTEPGVYQVECIVQFGNGDSASWGFEVTIN